MGEYAKKSEKYQMDSALATDLHLTLRQLQPLVEFAKNMKKESQIYEEGMKELKSWWRMLLHLPSQTMLLYKLHSSIGRLKAMVKTYEGILNSIPENDIKIYAVQNVLEESMKRKREE